MTDATGDRHGKEGAEEGAPEAVVEENSERSWKQRRLRAGFELVKTYRMETMFEETSALPLAVMSGGYISATKEGRAITPPPIPLQLGERSVRRALCA